jgi:hypothetical protein
MAQVEIVWHEESTDAFQEEMNISIGSMPL